MAIDLGTVEARSRISALSFVSDALRLRHADVASRPAEWITEIAAFLADGDLNELEAKLLMLRSYSMSNDTPQSVVRRAAGLIAYIRDGGAMHLEISGTLLLPMIETATGEDDE